MIDKWVKDQIFYFASQSTVVSQEKDSDQHDPHFTTKDGYFPLSRRLNSVMYSALPIVNEGHVPVLELFYGVDELTVDDSIYSFGSV